MNRRFLIGGAALGALAAAAAPTFAEFCGAFCDSSNRAGRVFEAYPSDVAMGAGATRWVRTWLPHLIDTGSSLQNGTAVAIVDGRIVGANTSFSTGAFDPRTVIIFGTARQLDSLGGFTSNDIIVFEPSNLSNTVGDMLPDGRLAWRANFGTGQNNLETLAITPDQQTPLPEPDAGDKILAAGPGIDGAAGSVFLGTPAAIVLDASTMFVGNTNFDAGTGDVPSGTNIFMYAGTAVPAATPFRTYSQAGAETYANANGLSIPAGNGRQTQPVLARVGDLYYVAFGVNDTAAGGSARPAMIVVDAFYDVNDPGAFDGFTGAVNIQAPAGWRYVDHQATGGGTGVFEGNHFTMNSAGDIAALIESDQSVPTYAVLYYEAIKSGDVITGYAAPVTIADAGPLATVNDGLVGPIILPDNTIIRTISGVSINDRGNIAFNATYDTGIPVDPEDPEGDTFWDTAVYIYIASEATLHQVLREFDLIQSSYSGAPGLLMGLLPTTGSDAFFGSSLARSADVIAVNFRPNSNDLPDVGVPSRGVAVIAVGHVGDVNFDGFVGLGDLSSFLSSFGASFLTGAYNPQADFDLDGVVGLSDLSLLLTNFGTNQ